MSMAWSTEKDFQTTQSSTRLQKEELPVHNAHFTVIHQQRGQFLFSPAVSMTMALS